MKLNKIWSIVAYFNRDTWKHLNNFERNSLN